MTTTVTFVAGMASGVLLAVFLVAVAVLLGDEGDV